VKLMHENSLFAILLRARWWVSLLVALGLFALLRLAVPEGYALFAALPFLVIACIAGWRQLRAPSAARVAARLERLRALSWEEFSAALEAGLRREGYGAARLAGGEADFELTREGRLALLACRRWKAARTGVEPLRELHAAGAAREIGECLYVCAGELSAQARAFAAEKRIRLVEGAELARLAG
jgi:restriction system protein